MSKARISVSLTLILIFMAAWGYAIYEKNSTSGSRQTFLENYGFIDSYGKISSAPHSYRVSLRDGTEDEAILVFESSAGYQSQIEMAVLFDREGDIIDVETVTQGETPQFYERLSEYHFFDQFAGQSIEEGFECGVNVDAVSRATISSKAVAKAVHKGVSAAGSQFLNIDVEKRYSRIPFGVSELAIILLFGLVILSYRTKNKKLRYATLTYSVIVIGFKLTVFVSYSYFYTFITGNWPSMADDLKRYLIFFGSIALILSTGKNLYCSHICPFGAFQELEYRLAKLPTPSLSVRMRKALSKAPGILAYTAFLAALLTGRSSLTNYEPFSLLYGGVGTGLQWALLPLTLFSALFFSRFYCRAACPVGVIMKLIARFRKSLEAIWKRKTL